MPSPAEPTVETLREVSRVAGFAWSDAELQALRPAAVRFLALLASLETVPLADVEAAVQYRIL